MYYTKPYVFFTRQWKKHTWHSNAPEGDVECGIGVKNQAYAYRKKQVIMPVVSEWGLGYRMKNEEWLLLAQVCYRTV
jgi:hypothetical protein